MRIYIKPLFFLIWFGIGLNTIAQVNPGSSFGKNYNPVGQSGILKQDSSSNKKTYISRIRSWNIDEFLGEKKRSTLIQLL